MTLSVGYYDAATLLYEYAWAGSFHFSRFYKGEGFIQAVRTENILFFRGLGTAYPHPKCDTDPISFV